MIEIVIAWAIWGPAGAIAVPISLFGIAAGVALTARLRSKRGSPPLSP